MSCSHCELKIENCLSDLDGLINVKASYRKSIVEITFDNIKLDDIISAIEGLEYQVTRVSDVTQTNSYKEKLSISQFISVSIIILGLYIILKNRIDFNFIPEVNQSMGYGVLFVVGLFTSIHCIAMCGGINLSQCVPYRVQTSKSKLSLLVPSFMYNLGRIVSYTLIGGIVGGLGSVISLSGTAKSFLTIGSGIIMIIMGLNMANIFPSLRILNPRMPKSIAKKINSNKDKYGPFYVGLVNGLMPCGPLQAMQIYALGTGGILTGALSMFMFSIGTVPVMFGFGAISSLLSGKFTNKIFRFSAMLVMLLGLLMINRGLALAGVAIPTPNSNAVQNVAKIKGDIQEVKINLQSGRYVPIVVQKGIPVKWIIKAEKRDLNGCNNPLMIPQYNIKKSLVEGENIIEFTPEKEGNISYTCWMGMIRSNIKVVEDIKNINE